MMPVGVVRVAFGRVMVAMSAEQGGIGWRGDREGRRGEREREDGTQHDGSPYGKHRPDVDAS